MLLMKGEIKNVYSIVSNGSFGAEAHPQIPKSCIESANFCAF